jgi:hypothetical protein
VRLYLPSAAETFASEVETTLSLFKLLDTFFKPLPPGNNEPIPSIAAVYLERRVLNERPGGAPVLLWIRSVANKLSQETGDERDERDYIKQLCPLVLNTCRVRLDEIWVVDTAGPWRDGLFYGSNLDADVYITALYTQTLPVIAKWIPSGKNLAKSSLLFGRACTHAARYGNHEILAAMMDLHHEGDFQNLRAYFLQEVSEFGRIEITRFIMNFKATQRPWVYSKKIKRPTYYFHNERVLAQLHTPSREIFAIAMEKRGVHCVDRTFGVKEYTTFLVRSAYNGWADMTACYLALGACADGMGSTTSNMERPLLGACRNGHREVVKVLVGHSANTCQPALETAVRYGHFAIVSLLLEYGAEVGEALAAAVAKGYKTIVCAILEQGASIEGELQELLRLAVEIEDQAIFRTLIEYAGEAVNKETLAMCVKEAREKGLDSMAELIESY